MNIFALYKILQTTFLSTTDLFVFLLKRDVLQDYINELSVIKNYIVLHISNCTYREYVFV